MKKTAIIGFGRFGELFARLAKDAFHIHVVETDTARKAVAIASGYTLIPLEAVSQMKWIFLAAPISALEGLLVDLVPILDERHVVIDLCSVKVYPARLMQRYLTKSQLLATHPMFGPESAKQGLVGLHVALCPLRIDPANTQIIRDFWTRLGVIAIETTPEAHDHDAVYSQAFTYAIARIIRTAHVPDVTFKTRSLEALTQVAALSANDSKQLFHDFLFYNPYFADMKRQLEAAIGQTIQQLSEIETEQRLMKPL